MYGLSATVFVQSWISGLSVTLGFLAYP